MSRSDKFATFIARFKKFRIFVFLCSVPLDKEANY